jgi:hypothetical protein
VRDRSPIEKLLTYATFFSLSLVVHIVVILGNRPLHPGEAAASRAQARPAATGIGAAEMGAAETARAGGGGERSP